jgi:hypothetical protein
MYHIISNSTLDGGGWSIPRPRLVHPRLRDPALIVQEAGWGPGRVRKISQSPRFDSRTLQPVSSRYTDWAIPVLSFHTIALNNALSSTARTKKMDVTATMMQEWQRRWGVQTDCYSQCVAEKNIRVHFSRPPFRRRQPVHSDWLQQKPFLPTVMWI